MTELAIELKKILDKTEYNWSYICDNAYLDNGLNKYSVSFSKSGNGCNYNCIAISVMNRNCGKYDSCYLHFSEVFGKVQTTNPNFKDGCFLHLWHSNGHYDWYVVKPSEEQLSTLARLVNEYISVFG